MEDRITEGLSVIFDGDKNHVVYESEQRVYGIGAMMCEYSRFSPFELKELVVACPHFGEEFDTEKLLCAVLWLCEQTHKKFHLITAEMIICEMTREVINFVQANEEQRKNFFEDENNWKDNRDILDFIFKDTEFTDFGGGTIGQILLFAYFSFSMSNIAFKLLYNRFIKDLEMEENDASDLHFSWNLYSDLIEVQHIDFRIINMQGMFRSLYQIKSSISLLLFEIAHIIENEIQIVKCQNCGCYFVPETRVDTLYCNYESPQKPGKTCRNIGAQITRAKKEKKDITTKEYRKVYMRYVMHMNRHPGDDDKLAKFNELTGEVKEKRKQLEAGEITEEDFLDWLSGF